MMMIRLLLLAFILPSFLHAEDYDPQKTAALKDYLISLDKNRSLEWSEEIARNLRTLIDEGANPDVTGQYMSAVDYTAYYGDMDLVEYYFDKGASIRIFPFILLFDEGHHDELVKLMTLCSQRSHVMKYLEGKYDKEESLGSRVLALLFQLPWKSEYADLVTSMVNNGANINGVSHNSSWHPRKDHIVSIQNPLMRASELGNLEAMKLLLGLGANIELEDEASWTALIHAARANKVAAMALLLRRGATMDTKALGFVVTHLPQAARVIWTVCANCKDQDERNGVLEAYVADK